MRRIGAVVHAGERRVPGSLQYRPQPRSSRSTTRLGSPVCHTRNAIELDMDLVVLTYQVDPAEDRF
jgi:hypothetical protein